MRRLCVLMCVVLLALVACQPGELPTATAPPAPTITSVLPTEMSVPPTMTPVPPTPTATPLPTLTGSGGGRIAFSSRRGALSSQRNERDYEVLVMNADGTDVRRVTNSPFEDEGPSWSPDGTRIAYTNDNYAGHCDIYVVDVYSNERQRLTTQGNAGSLAWSPDGKTLAFSLRHQSGASGGGQDLYIMAVPDGTGGEQGSTDMRLLVTAGANVGIFEPTWSPDGKYIACVVNASPNPATMETTVYVLDVQEALQRGGIGVADLRMLPRAGDQMNDKPAWSPDGTRIAYSAMIGDHRDIYIVNADGTGLRPLTQTKNLDEHDPAWSPDGTRIAFQGNPDANWDIFIIAVSDEPATDMTGWQRLTNDVANDVSPDWAP